MDEASKTIPLLQRSGTFYDLTGTGIDIGCGNDPIKVPNSVVVPWDMIHGDGDAFTLPGVKDESFDWVFSSHCLEDSTNVPLAINRWAEVLKPHGIMIILVPSFTLYEHRVWPSKGNGAHKASFDLFDIEKPRDHPHFNLGDMIFIGETAGLTLVNASLQCDGYDFTRIDNVGFDQTRHGALAQCMFVFIKK